MSHYTADEVRVMFTSPRRPVAQGFRVRHFVNGEAFIDEAAELTMHRYLGFIAAEGSRRREMSRLRASLQHRPELYSVDELRAMLGG